MATPSPASREEASLLKIVLLWLAAHPDGQNSESMLARCQDALLLDYIRVRSAYVELLERKLLAATEAKDEQTTYPNGRAIKRVYLSTAGRQVLAQLESQIPPQIRRTLENGVEASQDNACPASWAPYGDGRFRLHLAVREQAAPVLELQLLLPDEERARRFAAIWQKKAGDVYRQLLQTLEASAHSSAEKSDLAAPQSGQTQSSGISSKAVPGAMPPSASPSAGS